MEKNLWRVADLEVPHNLPDPEHNVLIIVETQGRDRYIEIGHIQKEIVGGKVRLRWFIRRCGTLFMDRVIYWMPLPEIPKVFKIHRCPNCDFEYAENRTAQDMLDDRV